ncbi:MAG: hypothetical protein B6I38_11305 [Anaerolineaceae bacterium 4572_5.1]|nr:MAG: hypothetical protein B6I38_11305 [Anaerolineaceae bacterium 4572_5.1]
MADSERPLGKTTIAPSVLVTIAKEAALHVEGVSRLAQLPGGVNNIFRRGLNDGVRLQIKDDQRVYADIYAILTNKVNVRDTGKKIQQAVERAISQMVGLEVGEVSVHIQDIDFPEYSTED